MQAKPKHRAGPIISIEGTLGFLIIVISAAFCLFSFALGMSSTLLPEWSPLKFRTG